MRAADSERHRLADPLATENDVEQPARREHLIKTLDLRASRTEVDDVVERLAVEFVETTNGFD